MTNARLDQIEKEFRAKSEARDNELNEIREALGVHISKQATLESSHAELRAVVNNLRDIRPPGLLALWGPAIALAAALASGFSFILNTKVDPIAEVAKEAKNSARDLSGVYGNLSRKVVRLEEQNKAQEKQLELARASQKEMVDREWQRERGL